TPPSLRSLPTRRSSDLLLLGWKATGAENELLADTRVRSVHTARRGGAQPESDCHAAGLRPNGGASGDKNLDSGRTGVRKKSGVRSEEHTSELQSPYDLV